MSASRPLSPLQTELLVGRAQIGDLAAFHVLVRSFEPRLLYFIRRLIADEHYATDVLQDVWLSAFQNLRQLRAPAAFRGWLYQIAHDRAVAIVRRKHRSQEMSAVDIADREVESIDEFIRHDEAAAVHRALARLSAEQRAVIVLRFLEDLSLVQIADVIREPLGTVKSRLHYGKAALRRLLAEESIHE